MEETNIMLLQTILNKLDSQDKGIESLSKDLTDVKIKIVKIQGEITNMGLHSYARDIDGVEEVFERLILKREVKKPAKNRELILWGLTIINGLFVLAFTFEKLF